MEDFIQMSTSVTTLLNEFIGTNGPNGFVSLIDRHTARNVSTNFLETVFINQSVDDQ